MRAGTRILLAFLVLFFLSVGNLAATEEYAGATGRDCGVCHVNHAGGGELTAAGSGYAQFVATTTTTSAPPSTLAHALLLTTGFVHTLFAFFWFGTILYVHLILKPAYASQGLPRGEVRLGLVSMVIMGVTGAILFAYRVPSVNSLFDSRFGILLLLKIGLYLIMVVSALVAVFIIGPRMRRKKASAAAANGELTLEELAHYDGQEGRPTWFAYRGAIYDASQSTRWKNGVHMGRHKAGTDLTSQLGQAPHGENLVVALPQIGILRDNAGPALTPPQRVFFVIAYLNLGFVLAIILILACWKWL